VLILSDSIRVVSPKMNKNSAGDEIANVNFLRPQRTCRGQRLCASNRVIRVCFAQI